MIEATNHGPEAAPLHLLPQMWFRNTWAWGRDDRKPALRRLDPTTVGAGDVEAVECEHGFLGRYVLAAEGRSRGAGLRQRDQRRRPVRRAEQCDPLTKDGINNRVVHGDASAVQPDGSGTKAAFWYRLRRGRAG